MCSKRTTSVTKDFATICGRSGRVDRRLLLGLAGIALLSSRQRNARAMQLQTNDANDPFNSENWLERSGDDELDLALIAELKSIVRFLGINPGFKYIKENNAFAFKGTIVEGTKGAVLLGIPLIRQLMNREDGGFAVAGICAHECAHIYQFEEGYFDRMENTVLLLELHADFIAGYYLGKGKRADLNQLTAFSKSMFTFGDYSYQDPLTRGSPGQRIAAVDKGFKVGTGKETLQEAADLGEKYVRALQ